jgi:RNA polymerase sigma factor (sigma-70 family)
MSPLILRRYRADRLLNEEFERLRERVIAAVDGRLRRGSVALDRSDLEAAYAQAWHGLHAAVLEGQSIVSPAAWLIVVAHRRALDEHRARKGAVPTTFTDPTACPAGRDLDDELEDRARVRTLLEALRTRLSERERQAAALCYLQGLSRAEAAAQMGISSSRMRKLMEGGGKGLRGVAAKVGALVRVIAGGEWCEEQGSLMRGLAFGMLDPQGDRYRLAHSHSEACPACRAYVLSLRGLAVVLPPAPALLHPLLAGGAAGVASGALTGSGSAGAGVGGAAGAPLGAGAVSASSAAGAGAAGGGWWLAGGVGAKLAAGCLLALGVGAGCVALEGHGGAASKAPPGHVRGARARASGSAGGNGAPLRLPANGAATTARVDRAGRAALAGGIRTVTASARASREFGLERTASGTSAGSDQKTGPVSAGAVASAATAQSPSGVSVPARTGEAGSSPSASSSTSPSAAAREFSPG